MLICRSSICTNVDMLGELSLILFALMTIMPIKTIFTSYV